MIKIKQYKSDIFTQTSNGEHLTKLSAMKRICREYYGNDKNNKPNDKCFWDNDAYIVGWYENDESLRERVMGENNE